MSKRKGGKPQGVVVDIKDPRKAMIDAGWGGNKPDRRKRTSSIPWIERVRRMFS